MENKLILNITDAPIYTKALPFAGLLMGIALAKYQKKDCWGCYLGYGLSGLLLGSIPLYLTAKQ